MQKTINFSIFNIGVLLSIIFVILKLCKVIAWSWWWVISPVVFAIALTIIVYILLIILALVVNR